MQKSFLVSLVLSFVFAFTTVAYLSAPFSPKIQFVTAEAASIAPTLDNHEIDFRDLDIISLHEVSENEIATSIRGANPHATSAAPKKHYTSKPVRLFIPAIGLDTSIDGMGVNSAGEMDVPDGNSPHVGWYKYGTIPGNIGSAVIDAHVFAAFENLNDVLVGSSIFVMNEAGEKLEFKVEETQVYERGSLSANTLFNRKDARRLNLITCAGSPTADGSTYTHRLVVYTTLVA